MNFALFDSSIGARGVKGLRYPGDKPLDRSAADRVRSLTQDPDTVAGKMQEVRARTGRPEFDPSKLLSYDE
jgi:hypothetical protein